MLSEQFLIEVKLKADKIEDKNAFPFNLNALQVFTHLRLHPKVTFLVGENGSGKSTLLEAMAIASGFNAEGGTINFGFSTRDSHSDLSHFLRLSRGIKKPRDGFFLRAESFFNVATEIEALDLEPSFGPPIIESYGGQSLHEQSHGESFFALLMNRFAGNSLFFLDEPEAALSPSRQMSMLVRMQELINANSQFIIATHSPILMAYPDADIYVLGDNGIVKTSYEDTDHYQITKSFVNDPDGMLQKLLSDDVQT
jgi:predicted ATPase